ncbi:hypothetical protein B4U84_26445 [Westiellopsis prolifica IICB1]|nr:hypothetical protein B4U84_26445 [Westiellopsis prolifica IICB1]
MLQFGILLTHKLSKLLVHTFYKLAEIVLEQLERFLRGSSMYAIILIFLDVLLSQNLSILEMSRLQRIDSGIVI